jgi:hypothetical protein
VSKRWLQHLAGLLVGLTFALHSPAISQAPMPATAPATVTFADLADLTQLADIVAIVEVRRQTVVPVERAPGLAPGQARLYIEGRMLALLASRSAVGESQAYLVDVPLDARGRVPKLKKQRFMIFADAGRPGQLTLVRNFAQIPALPGNEALARRVIAAFAAADVPPAIAGVRDVMSVAGNLAGESETQLFLDTAAGEPVSLSVVRRPGMAPEWGVSWSEIVDQAARPPAPETVEWYRLACFLPAQLPTGAFLQNDRAAQARAEADFGFIRERLGPCPRTL